jgi:geranylgeranyl pyrophosphate synthase
MTAHRAEFPLSSHRASLAQYLREIVFPGESVAHRIIIEERLPEQGAGDPVRASLVLWACEAAGGNLADALPVAAAFDLFDRFLLLHAELSDDSAATIARWGLGQSLNAGDALYALAFRTLASDVVNAERRVETAKLVGHAVLEAIEKCDDASARDTVLTGAALQAGALIAGAPDAVVRTFADAGRLLGRDARGAVSALRRYTSDTDLARFEEVARYVARRAA